MEVAFAATRLPCAKSNGAYQPISRDAPSESELIALLMRLGGSRYLDELSARSKNWTARVSGLGTVQVATAYRNGNLQIRISPVQLDATSAAPEPIIREEPPARGSQPQVFASKFPEEPMAELELAIPPVGREVPQTARWAQRAPLDFDIPALIDPSLAEQSPAPFPERTAGDIPLSAEEFAISNEAQSWAGLNSLISATIEEASPFARLEQLLSIARDRSASALHIVAQRPPLIRALGDLVPDGEPVSESSAEAMLDTILPERFVGQLRETGAVDFAYEHPELGRFRVNATSQRTGPKICFRLIPFEMPTLESLGLPESIVAATEHHQGLILVTGPTGQGKTTTLNAIVDRLNRETTHHIITVEDPVEMIHPPRSALMSQREVGTNTKTFASALKASLREDPDVIVVGELRDTETVRMAVAASETGHLVIGTMNTPSAAKTIDRVIDLFPPGDQAQIRMTLAGSLRLVLGQRLVPRADGSGFVAAVEVLPGSVPLWSLIRDNKTFQIPSLQQRGKGLGIIRLDESLQGLVRAGVVTAEAAQVWAEGATLATPSH